MYTRKLLKNNITVGTVLGAVAMLLAIIFFFKYISFQDAKQDIDEMISDHGVLTAEDKDKIDLFQPTLFMILGGSLAFGAAVYVQMFMMSLQMKASEHCKSYQSGGFLGIYRGNVRCGTDMLGTAVFGALQGQIRMAFGQIQGHDV